MKETASRRVFVIFNYIFLGIAGLVCFLPFLHVLAISLSASTASAAGKVFFWPVGFHTYAYNWLINRPPFWQSLLVSLERVVLGYAVNMLLVLITAYPLSKEVTQFRWRTIYVWYFFFTAVFSGGLIPAFLIVKYTKIMNTIWALVIPGALSVWNMILMLNFFRQVPKALEEAALIDGATQWTVLFRIYLPVSLPAIATISLFTVLGHWNSWFDGLIYLNDTHLYPFQTYLRTMVANTNLQAQGSLKEMQDRILLSDRNLKDAQIFIAMIPILLIYPFLQRYFTTGIVIGSVKG